MGTETLNFNLLAHDNASRTFNKVGDSSDRLHKTFGKVGAGAAVVGRAAAKGLGIAAVAATGLGVAGFAMGVKTAGALQQAHIGFETMLGSGKKAERFLGDLKVFAARTPFELPGLIGNARQLLGVGVAAKDVVPFLQDFGDAAGALGINQEAFSRAMLAMSQSISAGKIKLGDMNQLMNAGLPIWQLLSEAIGKPVPEIQAMISKGELLTKDVLPKLQAVMHKDYGGAMQKQSQTLNGLWSTFMDTLNIGLADAIMPLVPVLQRLLPGAMQVMGDALARIPGIIEGIGDFAGPIVAKIRDALPQIKESIGAWVEAFRTAFDAIVVNVTPIITSIRDGLARATGLAGDFVTTVKTAIDTGDWGPVGASIGTALSEAISGAGAVVGKITAAFGSLMSRVDFVGIGIAIGKQAPAIILGFVAGLIAFDMTGLLRGVAAHWQDLLWAALGIWLTPAKFIGQIGQLLGRIPLAGRFLEWGLNALKGWVNDMFGAVGSALSGIGNAFLAGFRRVFPEIGSSFGEALRILPTRLGVIAFEVGEKAVELMVRLRQAILNRIGNVIAALGELVGNMLKPFANIGSFFFHAGKDLVMGFINGIRSMAGAAASAAADMARSAVNAAKSFLKIGSPSKVFEEIGKWLGEGLVQGMTGTEQRIGETADRLVAKVKDAFKDKGAKTEVDNWAIGLTRAFEDRLTGLAQKMSTLRDHFATIRATVMSGGALSGLGGGRTDAEGNALGVTAGAITEDLAARVEAASQFSADISKLKALGLNAQSLAELAGDGAEQGGAAAAALVASGVSAIAEVNKLENLLAATANRTAQIGSAAMYKAGEETARGLAEGFRSQRKAIEDVMDDVAERMVRRMRRLLGIKSPSTVFAGIGENVGLGLVAGMEATRSDVAATTASLVGAASAAGSYGVAAGSSVGGGTVVQISVTSLDPRGAASAVKEALDEYVRRNGPLRGLTAV